jgi:hypothetical protein
MMCADGHSYEEANIQHWLSNNDTSPFTNLRLEHKTLTPNHNLRNAIEIWVQEVNAKKRSEAEVEEERVEAQQIEGERERLAAEEEAARGEAVQIEGERLATVAQEVEARAARVEAQQIEGERLAAEEEAARGEAEQIEGERVSNIFCSKDGCNMKAMKDGRGLCHVHGIRKKCSHQDCKNMAQKGGLCVRHGYKKKTCATPGCNNNAVKSGVCITHGAKRSCMFAGCGKNIFKAKKCRFHYRCSLCNSEFDWDPSITRVMGMLGFEVLEYLGMAKNNGEICAIDRWDYVFAIAGVCTSWRAASLDYLNWIKPKIGLMPTQGFCERKLNVSGFLSYLEQDDRFWSATTVYVPCGKADRLYYRDVKAICPAMTTLIHRTWLMMNGNLEYVLEGQGRHPCYRVYKHDKEYIQGETAWIKYSWDGKYEKFQEEHLVQLEHLVLQERQPKRTNLDRG